MGIFEPLMISAYVGLEVFLAVVVYRHVRAGGALYQIWAAARCRVAAAAGALAGAKPLAAEVSAGDAEVARQVAEELERRSVQFARCATVVFAVICLARAPFLALDIVLGVAESRPAAHIACGVVCATSAVGALYPGSITYRTLPAWHTVYMAAVCVIQSPYGASVETGMLVYREQAVMTSIALGLMCVRLRVLAVSYTSLSACVLWNFLSAPQPLGGVAPQDIFISEAVSVFIRLTLFGVLASLQVALVRQEIRSKLGHGAVSSLLGMVCDAAVDVDETLKLKHHEESLCCLLMHGPGKNLEGSHLGTYLQDEAGNLVAKLSRAARGADGSLCTDMFTGRLRDSSCSAVDAVVYHVPYFSITGTVHHLIGIRESSDGPDVRLGQSTEEAAPPEAVLSDAVAARMAGRAPASPRTPSIASSRASSVPGERTRTVDVAVADRLPIRESTEQFRSTFGLSVGGADHDFFDLLREDGEGLLAWIRERAGKVRAGALPAPHAETYREMAMRGRSSDGAPGEVRRAVRVCFPGAAIDGDYRVSINVGKAARTAGPPARGTAAARTPPAALEAGRLPRGDNRMHL